MKHAETAIKLLRKNKQLFINFCEDLKREADGADGIYEDEDKIEINKLRKQLNNKDSFESILNKYGLWFATDILIKNGFIRVIFEPESIVFEITTINPKQKKIMSNLIISSNRDVVIEGLDGNYKTFSKEEALIYLNRDNPVRHINYQSPLAEFR